MNDLSGGFRALFQKVRWLTGSAQRIWVILPRFSVILAFAMSKSRNWVFTLNNPSGNLPSGDWDNVVLCIATLECSESGTLHYQGYLEWGTARALSTCKLLLPTAHWEVRRGSRLQALQYVLKTVDTDLMAKETVVTSSDIFHVGEPSLLVTWSELEKISYKGELVTYEQLLHNPKKRPVEERLNLVKELIKSGASDLSIADEHFDLWVKYSVAFSKYRLLNAKHRTLPTRVIVITGPTGTGKSKWAMETFPEAYWKPRSDWWDGYAGQDCVVIDEFYGWLPHDLLLRLCDRYPLNLQVKGGTVSFTSKTIVITSNRSPKKWYKNFYFEAFERRVDEWRVYLPDKQIVSETFIDF